MLYLFLKLNKNKKICKLWDLNPRVQSTNDLESLPLDHSGKLATDNFFIFFIFIFKKYIGMFYPTELF